jgi:hypothetical protein
MNPPSEPPFRVLTSGAVDEELRMLAARATEQGAGLRLAAALRVIRERLGNAPRE